MINFWSGKVKSIHKYGHAAIRKAFSTKIAFDIKVQNSAFDMYQI